MSFYTIRENKVLAKISEFTVVFIHVSNKNRTKMENKLQSDSFQVKTEVNTIKFP